MQKNWRIQSPPNPEQTSSLAQALNVHKKIAGILVNRGILTLEDAKNFFRPELNQLHDPFLMADMAPAVERLNKAIERNENILIFGDYDVDGTTSVALVYSYLLNFYANLDFYIPDRYNEGYGISTQGIDYASEKKVGLIIALDCGVKANDKIEYAKQKGIDFIICDHHLPGDVLPDALVLDPKRKDCNYPFKELSGCGVGFKLLQAWSQKQNKNEQKLFEYIDFCAVSIAADIVPLVGENRVLAYYGIKKLNESPSLGLQTLLQVTGRNKAITITDLLFVIGPRINAAGRITNGKYAVELLISANAEKAVEFAAMVNDNNLERRTLDKKITEEALTMIEKNPESHKSKTTVLYKPDWHKGVIGIVASRVTEYYYKPTILLTSSNGKATGSARSVKDFDVYQAIEKCADLLDQYGGHKYAAGITIKPENITAFTQRFEKVVSETITPEMLVPSIDVDAEIDFALLSEDIVDGLPKFYRILKQMAPFGPANLNPIFITKGVLDAGYARTIGENHLKCWLYTPNNPQIRIDAIGFGLANHLKTVSQNRPFDVVYTLEENEWNGKTSLQLNIKDIKQHL